MSDREALRDDCLGHPFAPDNPAALALIESAEWWKLKAPPNGELHATHEARITIPGMGAVRIYKTSDGQLLIDANDYARIQGADA